MLLTIASRKKIPAASLPEVLSTVRKVFPGAELRAVRRRVGPRMAVERPQASRATAARG